MDFFIGYMCGVVVWAIVSLVIRRITHGHGTLQIDHSDPNKDIYRFNMSEKYLDKLGKKKYIDLKIDHNADLSQK